MSIATQITMNFEPVYHRQWDSCREYMNDRVIPDYLKECDQQKKYLAADLGMSPSELSRKLNPGSSDKRNFSVDDLEMWLGRTRDLRPVFYLLEKYSTDTEDEITRLKKRLAELEAPTAKAAI